MKEAAIPVDIAVVGGGPAGVSACLELCKYGQLKIALFETEHEIGGMPRSCHVFFGMRDMKRIYTGPAYARRLDRLVRKTSVDIHANTTVLQITPGKEGEPHQLIATSPEGLTKYGSEFVLLTMGCFETSRESRRIPGARCAGVFTTGALQEMVNVQRLKPGKRAIVIGSEAVAFSSVLTLHRAGVSIVGMVEEDDALRTYPIVGELMRVMGRFPIYRGHKVSTIVGKKRVQGVEVFSIKEKRSFELECDTVVCTGAFRPAASLILGTAIEEDRLTSGPAVDLNFMTAVPNIFAAGNILHAAYMHDLCAIEGRRAAQSIMKRLRGVRFEREKCIRITAEPPISYVVPQVIPLSKVKEHRASLLRPGVAAQMTSTIKNLTLQAWCGREKVWEASFSRLIGCTRIPIPIEEFAWSRIEPSEGLVLKVKGGQDQFKKGN